MGKIFLFASVIILEGCGKVDRIKPQEAVKELTMLLMYLTRFHKRDHLVEASDMAWKGYDFDIINVLDDEDFIRQGSHKSQSVGITEKGIKYSRELLDKFHIDDWKLD